MAYKFEVTISGTVQKFEVQDKGAKASIIKLEMANKNVTQIKVDHKIIFSR